MNERLALLIVDDEEAIRSALATLLGRAGFDVRVAANGAEALARIADARHELALDERVDVFVGAVDEGRIRRSGLEHLAQGGADGRRLVGAQHARAFQRVRVRQAADDIVFEQAPVEPERRAPGQEFGVGFRVEASRPQRRAHDGFLADSRSTTAGALRAAISAGSPKILMNPSAAAWSKASPPPYVDRS